MLTPEKMYNEADDIAELYRQLEIELLKGIAKRLKTKHDETLTNWQTRVLREVYSLNNEAIQLVDTLVGAGEERLEEYIANNVETLVEETDEALEVTNDSKQVIPAVVNAMKTQANGNLNNFIRQTLISHGSANGQVAQQYMKTIQRTSLLFNAGGITLDEAIKRNVKELADKGITSGFVDKGGRNWSIERYSEAVLRSVMQETYNTARTERMKELGRYTVLVSSHPKSREACAYCQGKVIDIRPIAEATDGYPSVYEFGYGEPAGHRGVNCKHIWFPFNPELHKNNQPQYDPEEVIEAEKVEQGRKYLARKIKRTKKELATMEALGEDVTNIKKKLRRQQAQLREYQANRKRKQKDSKGVLRDKMINIQKSLGDDYDEYVDVVAKAPTAKAFEKFANNVKFKNEVNGGYWSAHEKLVSYELADLGKRKYDTLSHEFGHATDYYVGKDNETKSFNEYDNVFVRLGLKKPRGITDSDAYMTAIRRDKERIQEVYLNDETRKAELYNRLIKDELRTIGLQDALDGMFNTRSKAKSAPMHLPWGHGARYYNKYYTIFDNADRIERVQVELSKVHGRRISKAETKAMLRDRRTASELFANTFSIYTQDEEMKGFVKELFPEFIKEFEKTISSLGG